VLGDEQPRRHEPQGAAQLEPVCELAQKRAIAEVAVGMVSPGQAIALGAGTTTWALAQHLLDVRDLHFDIAFLGCHGMSPVGLTTPNLGEAETNRAFVRAAQQLVVVADSTKWGTVGLMSFAELLEVDVLFIDAGISAEAIAELHARVGRLELVEP